MNEEKLKVLWVGDLVAPTGFSTVGHNILNNNVDYWDIIGLGVNYKGDPHDYPYRIFPAMISGMGNIYGVDRLVNIMLTNELDVVCILNDSWVISYYLQAIKENVIGKIKTKMPKIVVYFPVDSKYHNPIWYKDFDIVSKAITYTDFGVKVVKEAVPAMEVGVIPHGVDLNNFYKLADDRREVRRALFGSSIKTDEGLDNLFLVLNSGRNQPRKRLDVTIQGFSLFAYNKPDNVRLYMHTGARDSSIEVPYIAERFGVVNRLIMTNLNVGIQKVPVEKLNQIFNACDVGINTGLGEGWGLPNVEHAVTGAVQVVPRHSACEELFHDCGVLMETISDFTFDNSQTVGKLTSPREVARCLELLYENQDLREELSEKGRQKFIQPKYQWQEIARQWREIFNDVTSVSD